MTKIEWTDETWNPIRRRVDGKFAGHGCVKVSPGCKNCYAERMQPRFGHPARYAAQDMDGADIYLDAAELLKPLRWKKARMIFVCSMSDLFWNRIPDEWIDRIFAVMALSPQHTFQVLTKRAKRMRDYSLKPRSKCMIEKTASEFKYWAPHGKNQWSDCVYRALEYSSVDTLPNVWLGVSVEDQQRANERIPYLLNTPAAVRFISAEPLLGEIDLRRWMSRGRYYNTKCDYCDWVGTSELCGNGGPPYNDDIICPECCRSICGDDVSALDWVIVGGESGPKSRPMHPEWARSLRDQCSAGNIAFFFKQWGAWLPWRQFNEAGIHDDPEQTRFQTLEYNFDNASEVGEWVDVGRPMWMSDVVDDDCVGRVGKKAAGRLLDGVEYSEMPP